MTAFLAKSNHPTTPADYRTLEQHSLDVASALRVLLGSSVLCQRAADALGEPVTAAVVDTLSVLAFLHDLGKADARWQAYIRGGGPKRDHTAPFLQHLGTTPALLEAMQPALTLVDDAEAMLCTVVAHHGAPITEEALRRYAVETTDSAAVAEAARLVRLACDLYPSATTIRWTPAFSHAFAGVLMLADWLGSSVAFHSGVDREAVVAAELATTGWRTFTAGADPTTILRSLRPGQRGVLDAPLDDRLLLLEDSTGSGKTEAAVLRALALLDAGLVEGLYFAVPTRSAATELHERVAQLIRHVHPGQAGRVMRVIPTALDSDELLPDQQRSWAAGSTKTAAIAPIGIGTIDQALLSIMRVRHSWLRRAALCTKLLVIDEVHAGDAHMIRLVEELVRAHIDAGGHAMAMSATLGEEAKARLLARPRRSLAEARADAYPLLTTTSTTQKFERSSSAIISVEIPDHAAALARATTAAGAGARVLWIRSTVAEARSDRHALAGAGARTILHHSRYAQPDRILKDAEVLSVLGKHAPRDGEGAIVVGTQTVEQSLDIDADLLVTDAAPADVLLQRLGRLHRHERHRPSGFEMPRVLIIEPGAREAYLPEPSFGTLPPQGWRWIYPALPVVATLELLAELGDIELTRDQRRLVEAATHRDALRAMTDRGAEWAHAWHSYISAAGKEQQVADTALVDFSDQYGYGTTEAIATRLGDPTIMVRTPRLVSPLDGAALAEVGVPQRWWRGREPADAAVVGYAEDGTAMLTAGSLSMRYTCDGLEAAG